MLNNFIDIKSNSNLLVMKCYKLLFSKEIFLKIGNYILLSIILNIIKTKKNINKIQEDCEINKLEINKKNENFERIPKLKI